MAILVTIGIWSDPKVLSSIVWHAWSLCWMEGLVNTRSRVWQLDPCLSPVIVPCSRVGEEVGLSSDLNESVRHCVLGYGCLPSPQHGVGDVG